MSDPVELVAAHRPYGLDCKCGRPINSDEDWARHFMDALGLTAESHTYEAFETKAVMGGEGNMRYGGQTSRSLGYRKQTRLVSPWVPSEGGNQQ
jgi:hypothetical protein